ncbi:MAG: serine/threonine-protein phosphatase, partial [Armatimonadetes bacterium]|nr:serine/threonine-protein phosphatase [Armatimonadota bacterium]
YIPAEDEFRIGGDLYDLFSLDKDRLALVIGDVSGHGLSATSVMALTTLSIRGCLLQGMLPGMALKAANHVLCRYCSETTFVTTFVSILDTKKWVLQYANAGHHMPLILKNNSCELVELHSNVPLAVDELAEYPTYTADLGCTVGLLFYTDGLIEARNRHEMFGDERLLQMCGREINHPAGQILDLIEKQIRTWSGILTDDIAMLLIKKQTSEKSKFP